MVINYSSYRSSKSFNQRVRVLVLHYTAGNFHASIGALTGPNVSSHYLIPDPADPTYIAAGFSSVETFNLVDEKDRAWHAGVSGWSKRTNLNDCSIGIELVNEAKDVGGELVFPPFHNDQITALKQLSKNILARYPDIVPTNVVGHSDIAIGRKSDPGASFPWYELYQEGVGAWYAQDAKQELEKKFTESGLPPVDEMIAKFAKYGYDVSQIEEKSDFKNLVRAFQLHFRSQNYEGILDAETAAILYALVEKYKS